MDGIEKKEERRKKTDMMKKATKVGRYLRKVWVMVMKEIKLCLIISYLSVLLLAS